MSFKSKKLLLLYTDKYYFVKQVYPFGLDLIAHHLRRYGHTATIDYPFLPEPGLEANIEQILARTEPDLIGLGIRNIDTAMSCEPFGDFEGPDYRTFYFIPEIRRIVDIIKRLRPEIPVVAGGGAFTVSPGAILNALELNYGIAGEGEEPLRQFLEAFPDEEKISKIPGLVYRRGDDIVANPRQPYAFENGRGIVEREKKFNWAHETVGLPMQVKRGCNRNCSYCVEPVIEGRKFVFKDPDSVIQELERIAGRCDGVKDIFFVDTEFNIPDLAYCTLLIEKIIRSGLNERFRFSSQFLPAPFNHAFAGLLREAGFSVVLTCDSFSDSVLDANRSSHRKRDSLSTIALCEKFGIDCSVNLIFGLPGETCETIDQTIESMITYPPNAMRRYEYTLGGRIYQGTPLCRFVEDQGTTRHVYGNWSEGFLDPYYFCSPDRPEKVKGYVEQHFPFTTACQNLHDSTVQQRLAMVFLADQADWNRAAERFLKSDLDACSAVYDYLFRKLVESGETEKAITVSEHFRDAILGQGGMDRYGEYVSVVQYYLSMLKPRID
ncbi:MAG: radical SAM protein [Pseudomonadota bacterium]